MWKLVTSVILVVFLLLALGYYQFGEKPLDVRDAIEDGISSARKNGSYNLTPGDEDYLRVQLALYDYSESHGTPPDSLTDLVPVYFDSLPRNPVTKQPFKYTRSGKQFDLERPMVQADITPEGGAGALASASVALKLGEDFINPNTMEESTFVYDSTGKRDPFLPFDFSKRKNADGLLSPLEQYSLGQLRVSATLASPDGFKAMIEDEVGKGYTVGPGTKIGDSGGVVITIEKDVVKVLETEVDFTGKEKQRVVEMKLIRDTSDRGKKRKVTRSRR